ncbi:hypothetical protein FRC01_005376, partial [Tulasnella sp. 417]
MQESTREGHLRGQRHQRRLAELSAAPTSYRPVPTPATTLTQRNLPPPTAHPNSSRIPTVAPRRPALADCTLCGRSIPLAQWNDHLHDPVHVRKARLTVYHEALEEGSRDKFGVSITQPELNFGVIDISTLAEWPTRENVFYIRLLEGSVILRNIDLTSRLGSQAQFRDVNFSVRFSAALTLSPGVTYAVKVTFDPRGNRGHYEDRVEFTFQLPLQGNKQFVISRAVKATVTVKVHQQQLAPVAPYKRPKRQRREKKGFVTDGVRPANFERQKTAFCYPLPDSKIPEAISAIVQHGSVDTKVELIRAERLPADLETATYADHWQTLLWLEECQAEKDMEHYDQADVAFGGRFGRNFLRKLMIQTYSSKSHNVLVQLTPGTGKTVTIVEAIRQILAHNPRAKILACAPSNNAADIIADRLRESLSAAQLFRLNAPSRVKTLLRSLESCSLRYDDGSFRIPPPQTIMQYRVVVSTCAAGCFPHGVGVPNGHFTHIFIDEAGQASEPEVMIPIQLNGDANTTIILAGDPKQLGPVIRSPVARRLGLDISYLDRLMAMDMYKSVANRGVTHVKLIKNWRSHRSIIDFPNQQFYDGELEACADPSVADLCIGWDKLSNPRYPIIFHAIK